MREFVFNDAAQEGSALTLASAADLAADMERGILLLIAARHALSSMRMAASTGEIEMSAGITLADVLTHLVRSTRDSGRLLARLATKFPVENDLEDDDFAALAEWSIPAHPTSLALTLCACSGRIAATLSEDARWRIDPLLMAVSTDPKTPSRLTSVQIDNVYSAANASELAERLTKTFVTKAKPSALWQHRAQLFPSLDFAPRVERDLSVLAVVHYDSAVRRLEELEIAAKNWKPGEGSPPYRSKVTGESSPTMNKYGDRRMFQSATGDKEMFELHARLADGYRLHLREIIEARRIEIGYIGPHLPIVSKH